LWLVAIGVINSTISLYYYLLVVYEMYVRTPVGFEADGHGAHARVLTAASASPVAYGEGTYGTTEGTVLEATGTTAVAAAPAMTATHVVTNGHGGNGHAVGHSVAVDAHGGHGDHGDEPMGAPVPRDITADMPKEHYYPQLRIPWATTLGLLLFLAGVLGIGLYPTPVMEALKSASAALFAS
jgi:hypothetical protein